MNKKPFLNAFAAAAYVVVIASVMRSLTSLSFAKDTILAPMVVLSLFVLSASVMGFLFVYEPFRLYFENQKQEALVFFAKTVGIFACFTALFIAALFVSAFL